MTTSWLMHDMVRICPQTGDVLEEASNQRSILKTEDRLRLRSPRNAYVSFQLVVAIHEFAAERLTVELEPLSGSAGAAGERQITGEQLTVYAQWYHHIQGRYMPDALVACQGLIPHNASAERVSLPELLHLNRVPGQQFAAFRLDLFVPEAIAAGEYRGVVQVSDGQTTQRHPLALDALHTVLPNESVLTADLNSYADGISNRSPRLRSRPTRYADGTYFRAERRFYRMAHEHRTVLHNLPYQHSGAIPESFIPIVEGNGRNKRVKDWSLFDEHYGPYLDGSAFAGTKRGPIPLPYMYLPFNFHWPADYAKFGTKGYRTEFSSMLRQFHRHFTEQGWLSTKFELFLNHKKRYKLFPYDGDETRFVWDEKVNDIYYDLARDVLDSEEGAQFVFRTDASWSYGLHYSKYAHIIRVWAINDMIFSWFPEGLPRLKQAGSTVWTYGSAPKIERPLLEGVFHPMATVARGTDGFVYWESTFSGDNWPVTPEANGSTALFYPGEQLGIDSLLPCIRLKSLRNAMQVAECMERWVRQGDEGEAERRSEVQRLIGEELGLTDDKLWPGKPDFADQPPYTWSNAELSVAPAASMPAGTPPEAFDDLRSRLWDILK